MNSEKLTLAGLNLSELEKLLSPLPRFRAVQIFKWIEHGTADFDQMTDLPKPLREELKSRFCIFSSSVVSCHDDSNAKKIVIALNDLLKIESVLLKDGNDRWTACLSTQAGCPAGCVFCKTGSLGFKRNLSSFEIAEQFLHLQKTAGSRLQSENPLRISRPIDNIVIMGMGEPLLNLEQLRKAVSFFTAPEGMNFSRRRITVSTCGICDALFDVAENGPYVRLALSLTTADEKLRQKLMPVSKTNPLKKIKEALLLFQHRGGDRITLEIPLLGGINTREKDALLIHEFAAGINCIINLIPWNSVSGLEYNGKPLCEPERKEIEYFKGKLESLGLKVTKRYRKGRGVLGACGQLGAQNIMSK